MDSDDELDEEEFDALTFLGEEPELTFLPYSPDLGWTPEIRALFTACLTGDSTWAQLVCADLDRADALELLLLAMALLVVQMRFGWGLDADEMGEVWDVLSVRLAWLTDKWDGEPVADIWEMLREA